LPVVDEPDGIGDITARLVDAREPQDDVEALRLRARLSERLVEGTLPAPVTIDRFTLLERIGSGGLGVVYAAYDPKLDRRVAIKLLSPREQAGTDEEEGRARFVREAKAMARLSHPNVVPVYDVGIHGGNVFIVMELVDGVQLGTWLSARKRTRREILETFRAAGRGLAAAHAAGLVHRDFKPGNVMVGQGGRVRVMDLGLATPTQPTLGEDPMPTPSGSIEIDAANAFSTQPGTVMGTPAYMAPEQHEGKPVDAKADQFAFCVALYEALYGERPFAWKTAAELSVAVLGGEVRPAPTSSDVPTWLREVVVRGLAVDPGQRWPSMQALLAALGRDPSARWRRAGMAAAALAVAVGASLAYGAHLERQASLCAGVEERLVGVWDDERKTEIREAFFATSLGYGPDTWDRVEKALDDYTTRWVGLRRDACEATELRKEQSPEIMYLKMACLEQRLWEVEGISKVLATADSKVVENAVNAVTALTPLEYCSNDHLRSDAKLPGDARSRERVATLRARLAEAKGLEDAGKYSGAVALARTLVDEAVELGFRPVEADARYRLASALSLAGRYEGAEREVTEAALIAEEHRMDEIVARARIMLVQVVGLQMARLDEAEICARHAQAAVGRLRDRNDIEAELLSRLGVLNGELARYDLAREQLQRALEMRQAIHGPTHPAVAASRNQLGNLAYAEGAYDAAYEQYERALEIRREVFGPEHPTVATMHNNLGIILAVVDRYAEAKEQHQHALAIREKTLDADHPSVGMSHHNLAIALGGVGDKEGARAHYERAIQIHERAFGIEHPRVALDHAHLGPILLELGRADEGRTHIDRAVAIWEKKLGNKHPRYAYGLEILGDWCFHNGDYEHALEHHQAALAIHEQVFGPSHGAVAGGLARIGAIYNRMKKHELARPLLLRALALAENATSEPFPDPGVILRELARVLLAEGKRDEAIERLERALEKHDAYSGAQGRAAETRFLLARLLWKPPEERSRARELAQQAKAEFEQSNTGVLGERDRRQVETWLAKHR
jgi:tetratricopeptide (TPR) repeat protein